MSNSMSNRASNSMSNWVSNNSRVSNSMGNWMSNNSWVSNSMGNWVSNSVGIRSNTIISDISNITIIIIGISLVEGSTRVVISNSIGVRVGRGLSKVRLG